MQSIHTDERVLSSSAAAAPAATRVAVIGATGYAGSELAEILKRHRFAHVTGLFGSDFTFEALASSAPQVVFLAVPNETSAEIAPRLVEAGMRVIDLSGAFRLRDSDLYPQWYGFEHEKPELLDEAVYGLTEWCNGELKNARIVANPGCYPTSVLLALRPIMYLIDRGQPLICDSKSGVSGAGKKADLAYSFSELFGNFKAYGVGTHRHEPEIRQGLRLGDRATLVFVPHLLPTVRGILSTIHVGFTRPIGSDEMTRTYSDAYANAPFVRVLPAGQLPELKSVVGRPHAEIGYTLLQGGRRAVIVSVIDNLLKGAASQAVQNFNRMCGYAETEGLA